MFRTSIVVDDTYLIDAYIQLLQDAPEVVNKLVNDAVNSNRDRWMSKFREEPRPAVHPIEWTSKRQQRAFWATNGFGAGIPYQRRSAPNRLVDQWRIIVVYQPNRLTELALENNSPIEQFVTGKHQQRFHAITGWYKTDDLIDELDRQMTDDVETALIRSFYAVEDL